VAAAWPILADRSLLRRVRNAAGPETIGTSCDDGPVSSDPGPLSKPPRSALTVRHMIGALVVLVLVVLVAGGLSRSCTFAPAGPTVDASRLPVVDAPAELARLASGMAFPVRVPGVPADWRANSADTATVPDGGRAVRTGYLTPGGRYLRLVQSDAPEEALLRMEVGDAPVVAQGVVDVDGRSWVAYAGQRGEAIWIAEVAPDGVAPVRLLVTGGGSETDFRTLAAGAAAGEVLPLGSPG
jgi:hypothetical protein